MHSIRLHTNSSSTAQYREPQPGLWKVATLWGSAAGLYPLFLHHGALQACQSRDSFQPASSPASWCCTHWAEHLCWREWPCTGPVQESSYSSHFTGGKPWDWKFKWHAQSHTGRSRKWMAISSHCSPHKMGAFHVSLHSRAQVAAHSRKTLYSHRANTAGVCTYLLQHHVENRPKTCLQKGKF